MQLFPEELENIEAYFNYRNCLLKLVGHFCVCYIFKTLKAFPLLVKGNSRTTKSFWWGY